MTSQPEPFRVIIAGSQHLTMLHYPRVRAILDRLLRNRLPNVVVLSGAGKGADALGEAWAKARGLAVERYPADWKKHGKKAGQIRNGEMCDQADAVICFDDGEAPSKAVLFEAEVSPRIGRKNIRVIGFSPVVTA